MRAILGTVDKAGCACPESLCVPDVSVACRVQITETSMRVVSCSMKTLVTEWSPAGGERITVAAGNASQILLAVGKSTLVYLRLEGGQVTEVARTEIGHEIACLNLCALGGGAAAADACLAAVGTWSKRVSVLRLASLELLAEEDLGGEVIPRSLLLVTLEGIDYLLCALGDGYLFSFLVNRESGALVDKKKVSLGTQPMVLNKFLSKGTTHVFAASDRPTVIARAPQRTHTPCTLARMHIHVRACIFMRAHAHTRTLR